LITNRKTNWSVLTIQNTNLLIYQFANSPNGEPTSSLKSKQRRQIIDYQEHKYISR